MNTVVRLFIGMTVASLCLTTVASESKPVWDKTEVQGPLERSERITATGTEILYIAALKNKEGGNYWIRVCQRSDSKGNLSYEAGTYHALCANAQLKALQYPATIFQKYDEQWEEPRAKSCCSVS